MQSTTEPSVNRLADYVIVRVEEGVYNIIKSREGKIKGIYEWGLFELLSEDNNVIVWDQEGMVYFCNYFEILDMDLNDREKLRLKGKLRHRDKSKIHSEYVKLKDLYKGDSFYKDESSDERFTVSGFREDNRCIIVDNMGFKYEKDSDMLVIKG